MPRPAPPALSTLAVLSLLPCVATAALWVRTERGPPLDWFAVAPAQSYGIGTERGAVIAFLQRERPDYRDGDRRDAQLVALGFRYLRITSDGMRRYNLVVPLWAPCCASAVPPALWWRRWARFRRRAARGLCPRCGYDLTANVSGVCPECGTAVR